jgi:hypothetical protein
METIARTLLLAAGADRVDAARASDPAANLRLLS